MTVPNQMFSHSLKLLKGFGLNQLDYKAPINPTTTGIKAGMVCSLTSDGDVVKGLIHGAMPLFALSNQTDYDIVGDGGGTNLYNSGFNTTGASGNIPPVNAGASDTGGAGTADTQADSAAYVNSGQVGILGLVVATGSFELQSTEVVAATYLPNDYLTSAAPTSGGSVSNVGKLALATAYTNTICGVCSKGSVTNEWGLSVVQFWSVFIPPSAGTFQSASLEPFNETNE